MASCQVLRLHATPAEDELKLREFWGVCNSHSAAAATAGATEGATATEVETHAQTFLSPCSIIWTSGPMPLETIVGFCAAVPCRPLSPPSPSPPNPYNHLIAIGGSDGIVLIYDTKVMNPSESLVKIIRLKGEQNVVPEDNVGMVTAVDFLHVEGCKLRVVAGVESGRVFVREFDLDLDLDFDLESGSESEDVNTRFPKFEVAVGVSAISAASAASADLTQWSSEPILAVANFSSTVVAGVAGMTIEEDSESTKTAINWSIGTATLYSDSSLSFTSPASFKTTKKSRGGKVGVGCIAFGETDKTDTNDAFSAKFSALVVTGGWDGRLRLFGHRRERKGGQHLKELGVFKPPKISVAKSAVPKMGENEGEIDTAVGLNCVSVSGRRMPQREGGGTLIVSGGGTGARDGWVVGRRRRGGLENEIRVPTSRF